MQHVLLSNPEALITVGKAAELCQVYRGTVQRWIATEKLKAHKLPSGHYRIRVGDLHEFLSLNHLPTPLAMRCDADGRVRILIVDRSEANRKKMKAILDALNGEIEEAANGVDALLKIGDWKPSLVIMNPQLEDIDGVAALERISVNPMTRNTRVLISGDQPSNSIKKQLNRNPCVVGYTNKPMPPEAFLDQVQATFHRGPSK